MALPRFGDRRRMRVGLLGGSFNPAHAGHLHIAQAALRQLRLDQVWLLVSPGNPLKQAHGMASLAARLASAEALIVQAHCSPRRIVPTDIERHLHTRYTVDTLRAFRRLFPNVRFVWLMGADNLIQFSRWRRWMAIARIVPFAVLPRPTYTRASLASQAARRLGGARLATRRASLLPGLASPSWAFLGGRDIALSATAIRQAAAGEDLSPESPPRPPAQDRRSQSARRPARPPR